jgi:cytochrome c peroxidase
LREDVGLYALTKRDEDRGKFRTPSLREVGKRAAFMHNGAFKSLEEVVAFYDAGGGTGAKKDPLLAPLGLADDEKRALVAFLRTLRSKGPEVKPSVVPAYRVRVLGRN